MIFSSILNLFFLTVITGYSFAFKNLINSENKKVSNLDTLYGFFILIFISLFLNFFFPLKYFFYLISIIGFSIFLFAIIKKRIQINFFIHFLILFFLSFIIYSQGDNVDTPMYHLQIIKWISNEKIVFGLSNLEIRFGSNSLWFGLFSLFQLKYNNFNSIYFFNLIPFSIIFYQVFKKENKLSYIFLILCISFIILFSFLHPYLNGVILNHLHNTELDTIGMVFFILCVYLFLKFVERREIDNLRLLILCSAICLVIKLSYIAVTLFTVVALFIYFKNNILSLFRDKLSLFLIIFIFLWLIKNLIISGCLIFPVSFTCFNLSWSPGVDEIETYSKVVKGFARDTRERLKYLDFEHTIYTFNWFIPWFKDYALNTAFIQISFFIITISLIFMIIFKFISLFNVDFFKKKKLYLLYTTIFIPSIYIWFQAPEIRFGWGLIISISCFPLSILIFHFRYFEKKHLNLLKISSIFLFLLLIYDNRDNFNLHNLANPYEKKIDYSNIIKIRNINGFDIYKSINWQCYDFSKICVNSIKENYDISRNYGYLVIKN